MGNIRSLGSQWSFGAQKFQAFSYGLGGARAGSGSRGILQSSISSLSSRRISRGSRTATAGSRTGGALSGAGSRVLYRPAETKFDFMQGQSVSGLLDGGQLGTGPATIEAFGVKQTDLTAAAKPITSFVPDDSTVYADHLRAGEQAMKDGQFELAASRFRLANRIGRHAPESLLSLAHAHFALGNYSLTAYYVRQAITYFPELPLARIHVRSFFPNIAGFMAMRDKLRQEAPHQSKDTSLWLSLAYIEWFDNNVSRATEALRKAAETSTDPFFTDAVEEFWEGATASGKVSGDLATPLAIVQATSQPAPQPTKAPDQPLPEGAK